LKINSRFCFFGSISGALIGKTTGGAEIQIALLAKALAIKGHQVIVVDPYANESFTTPEGVKLINIPNWNKGLIGIRLIVHRIPILYKILKSQAADYYYVRTRSFLHLIPYIVARKSKAKFIQAIAQDIDVLSLRNQIKYEFKTNSNISKLLFVNFPSFLVSNYLLKRADFIFLQHAGQKLHSKQPRGKVAIFPNIVEIINLDFNKESLMNYIIHVGTLTTFKGSESLYKLIEILDSNIKVIVVGKPGDKKSETIYNKLAKFPNVFLKGRLDHDATLQLIANANTLINTSKYEGFPNIFLEAWATGVPVISLIVNPGNVINEHSLGICCDGSLHEMKTSIESFKVARIDNSKLILYIKEFHDFHSALDRFDSIIKSES
jgi:glycosyltransferase involved in cell wall biosynthesis